MLEVSVENGAPPQARKPPIPCLHPPSLYPTDLLTLSIQLIITSLQTYTFPNRDISRPDQLDESDKLKAHREAMRHQSVLLSRQCAKVSRLPAEMQGVVGGRAFLEMTEVLLGKARVWEKELVWGKWRCRWRKSRRLWVFCRRRGDVGGRGQVEVEGMCEGAGGGGGYLCVCVWWVGKGRVCVGGFQENF